MKMYKVKTIKEWIKETPIDKAIREINESEESINNSLNKEIKIIEKPKQTEDKKIETIKIISQESLKEKTVKELKEYCKSNNIIFSSRFRKEEIINLILNKRI
jgi:cellobiose-specific phosphotransferase system component IIA